MSGENEGGELRERQPGAPHTQVTARAPVTGRFRLSSGFRSRITGHASREQREQRAALASATVVDSAPAVGIAPTWEHLAGTIRV